MLTRCLAPVFRSLSLALVLLALSMMTPGLALRAGATQQVKLDMVMLVAGMTAGTMKLTVDFNDVEATTRLKLKSKGMVKMMTGYKASSEATSALPRAAWPMPVSYVSAYETNKHDRRIAISYSPEDGEISGLNEWKRGKPRRSKIPEALRQATVDPLTAILHMRHWILALRADPAMSKVQTFEIFDGRRRYRLSASIIERDKVRFGGERRAAYRVKVILEPLAGFRKNDMLANWSSEGGDRWIELLITDDDNPLPLSLRTKGGSLETSIVLEHACGEPGECIKFGS